MPPLTPDFIRTLQPGFSKALTVAAVAVGCVLFAAGHAAAEPGLLLGASEDMGKWDPKLAASVGNDLGLGAYRLTVAWSPERPHLDAAQAALIDRAVTAVRRQRIVLAIYGRATTAPTTAAARDSYCRFVENLLVRYSRIHDIVIWNEPNKSYFWQPQYVQRQSAAPAAYTQLLARCYPRLHAIRPTVNVIAALASRGNDDPLAHATISHSPSSFIREMGTAYRTLHLTGPLFDTFGQNIYGTTAIDPPAKAHPGSGNIGEGDHPKLLAAIRTAFINTGQPLPGNRGVSIWYMEDGFQTAVAPEKRGLYHGRENIATVAYGDANPASITTITQTSQLVAAIKLAYCQPYVGAYFNFLLQDEPDLARWQSGLLWADGTPKPAYTAVKELADALRSRNIRC
jgi:hypothetical protein